ncbi:unnamed protein product, partial [Effrenium voratum]
LRDGRLGPRGAEGRLAAPLRRARPLRRRRREHHCQLRNTPSGALHHGAGPGDGPGERLAALEEFCRPVRPAEPHGGDLAGGGAVRGRRGRARQLGRADG